MNEVVSNLMKLTEKVKTQLKGEGDMNTVLGRGLVTHCTPFSLSEGETGCWGWIALNEETAIGFKIFGELGERFLQSFRGGSNRAIFWGELQGKPAQIIVSYWMIS